MRRDQTRKLVAVEVCTTTELAGWIAIRTSRASATPPASGSVTRPSSRCGPRLDTPLVEVLASSAQPPTPTRRALATRGFAALPAPSPGDVFLDLEGDPYALDGEPRVPVRCRRRDADGERAYHAFWAHDRAEERVAFEAVVDFIVERRRSTPTCTCTTTRPYEPTAFEAAHGRARHPGERGRRPAARRRVRRPLRGRAPGRARRTESYSLKEVEKLYMQRPPARSWTPAQHRRVRALPRLDEDQALLDEIARLQPGRLRVAPPWLLRDWLEDRRARRGGAFGPIPRPEPADGDASEELTRARRSSRAPRRAALRERDADEQPAYSLLAQLLHWHRREEKPEWWAFFDRCGYESEDDFVDDRRVHRRPRARSASVAT